MTSWILLLGFAVLALTVSPWWTIGTVILGLWKWAQYSMYRNRPWKRLHFPLMRVYAGSAGTEASAAERDGRPFDPLRALAPLAEGALSLSPESATAFVRDQIRIARTFEDRESVAHEIRRRDPKAQQSDIDHTMEAFGTPLGSDDPGVSVRLVIAGITGRLASPEDRVEYLIAVANGDAR